MVERLWDGEKNDIAIWFGSLVGMVRDTAPSLTFSSWTPNFLRLLRDMAVDNSYRIVGRRWVSLGIEGYSLNSEGCRPSSSSRAGQLTFKVFEG